MEVSISKEDYIKTIAEAETEGEPVIDQASGPQNRWASVAALSIRLDLAAVFAERRGVLVAKSTA